MSRFSKFGKKKLAFALACASVLGGRTSAMNNKININKTGVKSSQTLGAVRDATVNKDFSNDKAKGFGNRDKNNKPVVIATTAAAATLVAVSVIGFTIFGSKKDNRQNPEFPNDPTKIKNLPPVVEKSKELFFDNISTKEQMFDAIKKIAQNYKFFGLNSSVVGFNSEATFNENDDAVEFYKQRNSNFKTQDDINKIQQNLNNLKNQLANIEKSVGKINDQNDVNKLNEEVANFKKKIFYNNVNNRKIIDDRISISRKKDSVTFAVLENNNGDGCRYNVIAYLSYETLRSLFNVVGGLDKQSDEVKKTASRLISFEDNKRTVIEILERINECNNTLKSSGMNENFMCTIARSKQFRKLFAPPVKIQDFKIVFNKGKDYGENKQNICFDFDFYDNSNQRLWCRYNMNFKDRKVEIAVGTQMQDISVQ